MIISDLNYLETVSEDSEVLGGGRRKKRRRRRHRKGKKGGKFVKSFFSFGSIFIQNNINITAQIAIGGSNSNVTVQSNAIG